MHRKRTVVITGPEQSYRVSVEGSEKVVEMGDRDVIKQPGYVIANVLCT